MIGSMSEVMRMASRKILEKLRCLPPEERRKEVQRLSELFECSCYKGTPYEIARRFERMRKAKDEANARILAAVARARRLESENGE